MCLVVAVSVRLYSASLSYCSLLFYVIGTIVFELNHDDDNTQPSCYFRKSKIACFVVRLYGKFLPKLFAKINENVAMNYLKY